MLPPQECTTSQQEVDLKDMTPCERLLGAALRITHVASVGSHIVSPCVVSMCSTEAPLAGAHSGHGSHKSARAWVRDEPS